MEPARDLTDSAQNRAVLSAADALLAGRTPVEENPSVLAEARAAARSRRLLTAALGEEPVRLSVVFAMYGETGRMVPRSEHPHGEDFCREKVRQLDWLTADLPTVTWNLIACDDGCPDRPSSAEKLRQIIATEGYPDRGHRSVTVIELAAVIAGENPLQTPVSPAFDALSSTAQSRKGGSVLAAMAAAIDQGPASGRHIVAYTDADLSANLAQLGSLAAPILEGAAAGLGQRYGMDDAVLVNQHGPSTEPQSTGGKPDKLIILFRHFVRALLIPDLAHVLDTQAGFKAFDAAALVPVLPELSSFNETFDVELLIQLAKRTGAAGLATVPMVFTEDFAATNFPSVDPGRRHLAMIEQVVELHDRLVAPVRPATGEAAALLALLRDLSLADYVRLIELLQERDEGDPTLFDRRWAVADLRAAIGR
ncbi:hypothetical protein ACF3NT_01555 [Naumannella halotolerans]|uniref:hypothetical protein n=1 Tax=Naumannella halotolerans TaxID=993414 RepID=UPI00370D1715